MPDACCICTHLRYVSKAKMLAAVVPATSEGKLPSFAKPIRPPIARARLKKGVKQKSYILFAKMSAKMNPKLTLNPADSCCRWTLRPGFLLDFWKD